MRLYAGSSRQFITDAVHNQIADKLKNAFSASFRYEPSPGEVHSWRNSLRAVSQVFQHANLFDHGVILEYQLPLTSRRLDCLICGRDAAQHDNAAIIELKQWEKCQPAEGENEVLTWVGGAEREVLHPSAQVRQYKTYLQDGHTAFYEGDDPVTLTACTYLHNYTYGAQDVLLADKFAPLLAACPVFTADDVDALAGHLQSRLQGGAGIDVLRRIEDGRYRPSKKLMEHVASVIKGNPEYVLLDEQLVVYDSVMACARKGFHDRKKAVLIVRGGPGTGKSVIAINLMADLLANGYNAQYATGSRAFTETLRKSIGSRGAVQFKYFNSYMDAQQNTVDILICDEAHRIRETSNRRFTKKANRSSVPQIEELLAAAKVCVFFIDDDQVVRPGEIGSCAYIREVAGPGTHTVSEYELEAQFRCSGSDAFVNWVNNTLGVRRTANVIWTGTEEFDFRIVESPVELEQAIRSKVAAGYTARLTAGFCWEWSKHLNDDRTLKNDVVIGEYHRPWNARPEATHLPKNIPRANLWAYDPNGINQIGCVYTAQGFEFDYVGVIFGNDLTYDLDKQEWIGHKENSGDTVVRRARDKFPDLIKNTYRVLLSRGIKGCYVYFIDKDTERFFKSRIEMAPKGASGVESKAEPLVPYQNSLPLLDLRAAANAGFGALAGEFPEAAYTFVRVQGGPFVRDRFLVRAEGKSMEPRISNGSLCLFRRDPGGSRNGKIVLCQIAGLAGDAPGAVIKRYQSARSPTGDSIGHAERIVLSSLNPDHDPIVLTEGDQFSVVGIFERVLDDPQSEQG